MQSILEQITDWLKSMIISGIMENLSGMFDSVNQQVGQIAGDVGTTPANFSPAVFSMIRNISESVILPIAGMVLTFIACYELIQMLIEHNNLANFETWTFFKWVFKTFLAVTLISNTFNITMAVFDVAQQVISRSGGLISGSTSVSDATLTAMQATLEGMDLGPLLGLYLQTFVVQVTMLALSAIIFVIVYGRMVEIYLMVSLAPIPFATFGNHEQSHTGQNYLRSLFALGFQGFLIMICVGIYAVLIQNLSFSDNIISSMAGKKNPNLGDKLRQEREGAENTLRDSRSKTADSSTGDGGKKKAEHRRQIRHEADLAKMRSKKLKSEQEVKAKKNAAASGKKGGKPKKPGNLAADALSAKAHQSVRNADQDNNSGVEAAHFTEGSAEGAARAGSRFQYGRKLRQYKKLERLEKKANKDAVDSIFAERMKSDPQAGSNLFSRWRQKQAIKKEYAAAKAGAAAAENTASGTAKAAQGTVSITEKAFQFVQSHSHIIIGIAAVGLLVLVIAGSVSSCSVLINGGGNVVLGTSYTAEDEDLKGVETDYTKLEDKLRKQIDRIETDHPGYDEYRYNLAEIGHNPYELASLLTVEFENYTRSQVQARLQSIFEAQYELKLEEKVEIRTRKETRVGYRYNPITGTGHTYTYQVTVQYEYKILNVTLLNRGVDYVARNSGLTDDQLQRYEVTLECRGNRDDLFAGIAFATPDGAGSSGEYQDYDIPGEALTDEKFRKMITEAEKYLGYPYVWGGSSPSTSFDCSGFVSWVINHCGNGWNVGRQTANGLMGKCDIIPKSEAKPGNLIFFQKTYNTSGASHVGIYVGNGMMIHCGSPISYASIETSYWRQHYYCMGRIR